MSDAAVTPQTTRLTVGFALLVAFVIGVLLGSMLSGPMQLCSDTHQVSPTGDLAAATAGGEDGRVLPPAATHSGRGDELDGKEALATLPTVAYRPMAACPSHRRIQTLLTRFIDIDFIEFVTTSCPDAGRALVLDIGLFHGGEVARMARQGFNVIGFEPNPVRFGFCKKEIDELPPAVRSRVELHNAAVSDQAEPLHFQLAGVDSHAYIVAPGGPTKIKSIVVRSVPIATVFQKHRNFYFVKVDTQGFDTRIVESMLGAMRQFNASAEFIQFEYSPYFEVTRSKRSKEDHKKFFRVMQDAGYDIFMGAVVQPWLKSMRSAYGKTPLSMISPEYKGIPTCVDDFVEYMHAGKTTPIRPGKTSTDFGSWVDLLAVRRSHTSPYYRHTGWVLARKM